MWGLGILGVILFIVIVFVYIWVATKPEKPIDTSRTFTLLDDEKNRD
jgi:hypothetical protein